VTFFETQCILTPAAGDDNDVR